MTTVSYTDQIFEAIKEAISEHVMRVEEEILLDKSHGFGPQIPIATIQISIKKTKKTGLSVYWRAKLKFGDQALTGGFPLENPLQSLIDFQKEIAQ